nr:hypothetical protein [Nitrosomonas nitrosa]
MPDHAAFFLGSLAVAQPFDDFVRGAELLVTAHHLDARAAVGIHEHAARAQHAEQIGLVQHAVDQLLLLVHSFSGTIRLRPLGFPGIKMLFAGRDRTVIGLDAAATN